MVLPVGWFPTKPAEPPALPTILVGGRADLSGGTSGRLAVSLERTGLCLGRGGDLEDVVA